MSRLLEDVRFLAGTLGPRGTGTSAEAAAADYVAQRLRELGLTPEKHSFRTVPSQNVFPLANSGVALLATLIYPWGPAAARWAAAALGLAAAWMLWQTLHNAFHPLYPLLPKVTSQNVEARLRPRIEPRRRIVILAHLDSNRCRLVWQSKMVRSIEPMTWLTLSVPLATGLLYLAGSIQGGMLWWWLSLPLAAYQLGTVITLLRDDRTPYSPGAHDNASSVAVALDVAQRLSAAPLQHTEVWFVFDGAEETDHAGVLDLLRRQGPALRSAAFIGLEGLGSGDLVYLIRQGLCHPYRPDASLLSLAERIAAKRPELDFHPAQMPVEDDVRSLRGRGFRALCIAGRDPQTNVLPRWHRPDDTPETVDEATMLRAVDILLEMLRESESSA